MKRRELKALPLPETTYKTNEKFYAIAQKINDVLILNVFEKKELWLRVFCTKDDYITYDMKSNKWKQGDLLYQLYGNSGWPQYYWDCREVNTPSAELIINTLQSWGITCDESNAMDCIDKYQKIIKSKRLMLKHKKETALIDTEMAKFGPLPDDYMEYVDKKLFREDNYIFYNTKKKRAFCSCCKTEFILENKYIKNKEIGIWNDRDKVEHNRLVLCPYCNNFERAKSEGMGRDNLLSIKWSVVVDSNGDEVLTRYVRNIKSFEDFKNPEYSSKELFRTVHSAGGSKDFMWAKFKSTSEVRWCNYKEPNIGYWCQPTIMNVPRQIDIYNNNIKEVVANTCMRYSAVDIFIKELVSDPRHFKSPWVVDNYFNQYRKDPYLEQMLKVGFYKLTQQYLESYEGNVRLNHGCKSILGTLGINKYQFNLLRRIGNPGLKDLKIIKYKPDLKWDDFEILRWIQDDGYADSYKKYIDLMRFTTLHKLRRYIGEQKITYIKDYFDYTEWIEEMGYDMRNTFNLFPKDFKKAHDSVAKQYMKFKNERSMEELKKFNQYLNKIRKETSNVEAMNLKVQGLFIRVPNEIDELRKEGEALHHCVGTYTDKVMKGKTSIFFIRQKQEPDKSFYTLEWNKGKVIQCRGYGNKDMTPEVKAFVKVFEEKMVEYEKKMKAG